MDLPKQQRAALAAAINAVGSAAELARRLGISPEAVCQWKGKVPVNRVIAVEAATGVSREHLRPDVFAAPRPAQRRAP
jgi:DNA-binding transcriptional regulator YdaS (Cro superfamily)